MRVSVAALGLTVAACGAFDPPDALGPYAVGHTAFVATDTERDDREVPVDLWYPVDEEDAAPEPKTEYPLAAGFGLPSEVAVDDLPPSTDAETLIVFSHGYGGINTQSVHLVEALASHGFVVAAPEHTGNAQGSMTDDFDTAAAQRVPDVSLVIDTVVGRDPFALAAPVGVIGHSFGGMTAIGCVAGWAGAEPDPRVGAIVPISAVIDGDLQEDDREGPNAGFTAAQLASVEVPVLLVGGTEDVNVPIENNDLAFDQLTAAPAVYQLDIVGATHTHFANVCDIGDLLLGLGLDISVWPALGAADLVEPYQVTCTEGAFPIEEVDRLVGTYAVAFFRRHLWDQRAYRSWLTEAHAEEEPAVRFRSR